MIDKAAQTASGACQSRCWAVLACAAPRSQPASRHTARCAAGARRGHLGVGGGVALAGCAACAPAPCLSVSPALKRSLGARVGRGCSGGSCASIARRQHARPGRPPTTCTHTRTHGRPERERGGHQNMCPLDTLCRASRSAGGEAGRRGGAARWSEAAMLRALVRRHPRGSSLVALSRPALPGDRGCSKAGRRQGGKAAGSGEQQQGRQASGAAPRRAP
jgi:hypothetical protein